MRIVVSLAGLENSGFHCLRKSRLKVVDINRELKSHRRKAVHFRVITLDCIGTRSLNWLPLRHASCRSVFRGPCLFLSAPQLSQFNNSKKHSDKVLMVSDDADNLITLTSGKAIESFAIST